MTTNKNTSNGSELTRPNQQNGGLTQISDQALKIINQARTDLNKAKKAFSEGSHTIQVNGVAKPSSQVIAEAKETLAQALQDGKLFLTKDGLNTLCIAKENGFDLGLKDSYHYHLRPSEAKRLEASSAKHKSDLATTEGQDKANAIDQYHMENGRVVSQSHSISIADGSPHLATTTTRKSAIGSGKVMGLATA